MRLGQNHKALGIVFLAMLLLGVYLTYGIFTKKFTDYAELTLRTSKIGLQLPTRADVKTRGVIVGEVLDFDSDAEGAVLTLGIYPDMLDTIPANVTGSIVPKTLFGEKYVSLEVPEGGPDGHDRGRGGHRPHRGLDRGREGALGPLPAAARGEPCRPQLHPQRARDRARGARREHGREPRDPRRLPQAGQPADPRHRRGPAAHRPRLRPLRRRAPRRRADPARHHQDHRDARGSRGQAARALPRRRVVLRHRAHLPRRQRGQPDPARRPQRRPAAACSRSTRRSTPACSAASSTPARPRPRRSAASPSTSCSSCCPTSRAATRAADAPRFGEDSGPNCLHLPAPPCDQENPVSSQPNFDDGVDEPTGKGTSRVAPGFGRPATGGPTAAGSSAGRTRPACCARCSPRPSASRRSRSTTSACCSSRRWPGERR